MTLTLRSAGGTVYTGPAELVRRMLEQGATPVESRSPREATARTPGTPVRVLAVVHGWMPYLAAGSERMMQHLLDALPPGEFETAVLCFGHGDTRHRPQTYTYEGTNVHIGYSAPFVPDIIITHHGPGARVCRDLAHEFPHAALVSVYHNERYDIEDIRALRADLEVVNTNWCAEALDLPASIVVHPPLIPSRHLVEQTGDAVTLINLQPNKGVGVFRALATQLGGEYRFLGVKGTHGPQEPVACAEIMETTQDMREVWSQTRVLLVPSGYESFGMVAAEACVSGIPVMASPTPGLVENLGHAGIFLPPEQPEYWESTLLRLLTDAELYREYSDRARLRATELAAQTERELAVFVDRMRELGG